MDKKELLKLMVDGALKKAKYVGAGVAIGFVLLACLFGGGDDGETETSGGAGNTSSSVGGIIGEEGGISLTTTMLDQETFTIALEEYYASTNNPDFYNNFLSKVDILYETAVANNVNPELVVVTAKTEGNFAESGGSFNYWGLGVPNGATSGYSYSSFEQGIAGYASTLSKYSVNGEKASAITARYEERRNSGCDPTGYGLPGTFSGMQSVYSFLGNHVEGSSGEGGYYYMDPARANVTKIYSTHEEFLNRCYNAGGEHAYGTVTTVWEQGQYTAWQCEEKIRVWNNIFGAYGSLESTSGTRTEPTGEGGVGGQEIAQGTRAENGYESIFRVGSRTYKNYKQGSGSPWANSTYRHFSPETIGESGCSITSVAVVATGFGQNITPADVEQRVYETGENKMEKLLSYYTGMNVVYESNNVRAGIIDQLKRGYPAFVHVYKHFFVILAVNEEETQFYASEVGGYYVGQGRNGWINIDTLMNYKGGIDKYAKMT